jgi:hypothetical protein
MDGRFGEIERDSLLNNRIESNRIESRHCCTFLCVNLLWSAVEGVGNERKGAQSQFLRAEKTFQVWE